ncbi:HD domain-containing protein [Lewinella sp. JB7]|uniref:HD domain-containing protein n=1 Tax=Lewinella sp. JB7 TaxID=2962887 RepID=UPI0020C9EF63|nr:HD domain-containing protein [Lewinella sp. JB7]MCP9234731.1 HD domain-containing protein [Lewinella sp. JB7]
MPYRPTKITKRAGRYVARLLITELPADRLYHNLHHTIDVVQGVILIGRAEAISGEEAEVLMLAAWFHDLGHIRTYAGHEAVSAQLARDFLRSEHYPEDKTTIVTSCILATHVPQRPRGKLQEILCDAELIHLSHATYPQSRDLLREEWKRSLGRVYSDDEWNAENENFLRDHRYFTPYGKTALQQRKEKYCF